jgi:hypothetical protein
MAGMYLSLDKREKKRFPFTAEQLKTIFASSLFATWVTGKNISRAT